MKKLFLIIVFLSLFGVIVNFLIIHPEDNNDFDKNSKIFSNTKKSTEEKKSQLQGDHYVLWSNESTSKTLNVSNLDSIMTQDSSKSKYTNHFFGYEFSFPNNWEVDNHQVPYYTRFFTTNFRLDIYVQDVNKAWTTPDGYISSTISSLKQNITSDTSWSQNGYSIRNIDYQRPVIKGIKKDLNYYSYYFITKGNSVYTFQLKTNQSLFEKTKKQVLILINSFQTTEPKIFDLNTRIKLSNKNPEVILRHNEKTLYIPKNHFLMGIYTPKSSDINDLDDFFETKTGSQMFYKPLDSKFDNYVEQLVSENRLPVVTFLFERAENNKEHNIITDILEGEFDANILSWAKGIKETEAPVFVRLGNEMNGDWASWSHKYTYNDPDLYKLSFKHIVEIFNYTKTDNAYFVWNPNHISSPYFEWNDGTLYYPGDEYVDFVGMTSYNFGKTKWNDFQEFEELYEDLYWNYSRSFFDKPLIIGEFGSVEPNGNKPKWINDAFNTIPTKYPNIKAAIWFDEIHGEYNLKIRTSPESAESFKNGMNQSNVVKGLQSTK